MFFSSGIVGVAFFLFFMSFGLSLGLSLGLSFGMSFFFFFCKKDRIFLVVCAVFWSPLLWAELGLDGFQCEPKSVLVLSPNPARVLGLRDLFSYKAASAVRLVQRRGPAAGQSVAPKWGIFEKQDQPKPKNKLVHIVSLHPAESLTGSHRNRSAQTTSPTAFSFREIDHHVCCTPALALPQNSVEDLKPRIELAKRLVRATPPRGEEYLGMLQIVLNRESAWTHWKDVSLALNAG